MPKNTRKAERLVAAMKKLHRMDELKKIELQRQLGELKRSQEDIITGLNSEDALHGMFMDTSTRFLRSLAREAQRVSQAHQHQSTKLLERAGKLRRAEKLRDTVSRQRRHTEGQKHLTEVIERYADKGGASLP
jgi:hypothetical protein